MENGFIFSAYFLCTLHLLCTFQGLKMKDDKKNFGVFLLCYFFPFSVTGNRVMEKEEEAMGRKH